MWHKGVSLRHRRKDVAGSSGGSDMQESLRTKGAACARRTSMLLS